MGGGGEVPRYIALGELRYKATYECGGGELR